MNTTNPQADRNLVLSLFNLVGAMAYKLMGEVPVIRIEGDDKTFSWNHPRLAWVRWEKPAGETGPACHE